MCLDPVLSHVLAVQDVESYAQNLKEAIKQSFHSAIKLLLVPVYSNEHWTLLVAQRKEGDSALTWRRYDTLSQEHAESHAAQVTLGTLFDPSFQLPQLENLCKQPKGSNACGGFVLHYMELEIKLLRGEVPELWPTDGWKAWKQRLHTAAQKLHTEQQKCLDEAQVLKAKEKSQQEEVAKQLSKAQEKIKKLTNITSQAYLVAQEQINKNSVRFTYKNLSPESTHKVLTLRYGFNCGSTLGMADIGTGAAVATAMPWATAAVGKYDIGGFCNGILAGLVSITAPCGNVESFSAFFIAIIGALIYQGARAGYGEPPTGQRVKGLDDSMVDDPIDAFAVHGAAGAWGVMAAALFDWGVGMEPWMKLATVSSVAVS
eukprot:Skav217484  [mRNA]  locus=scaffold1397:62475:71543:+ [translate_table: standard]